MDLFYSEKMESVYLKKQLLDQPTYSVSNRLYWSDLQYSICNMH